MSTDNQWLILVSKSIQGLQPQLHNFLQEYYQESNKVVAKKSVRIMLPLKISFNDSQDKEFIFYIEMVQYLHLNPQEFHALQLYSYNNKVKIQQSILMLLKELLERQKDVQAFMQAKKPKRQLVIRVDLLREMEWGESP